MDRENGREDKENVIPFIYEHMISERLDCCYIRGSRGMGKTRFLKELRKSLGRNEENSVWLDGRNYRNTRDYWHKIVSEKRPGVFNRKTLEKDIFFDNMDLFFVSAILKEEDLAFISALISDMDELINTPVDGEKKIVVATGSIRAARFAGDPTRLADDLDYSLDLKEERFRKAAAFWSKIRLFWSNLDMGWAKEYLDPWNYGWQKRLGEQIDKIPEKLKAESLAKKGAGDERNGNERAWFPMFPEDTTPAENELFKFWKEKIVEISDGHPGLIGPCCDELAELNRNFDPESPMDRDLADCERFEKKRGNLAKNERDNFDRKTKSSIQYRLETRLTRDGLKYIRKTLRGLFESRDEKAVKASRFLVHLAMNPDDDLEMEYYVREILLETGLVYETYDKKYGFRYKIPGPVVRNEILMFSGAAVRREQILELVPDPKKGERKGILKIKENMKAYEIPLSGASWKICRFLYDNLNDVVSLGVISKETEIETESALRSAIGRLERKIQSYGVEKKYLRNQHGVGYVLADEP